jgi:hypothetical protein
LKGLLFAPINVDLAGLANYGKIAQQELGHKMLIL